MFKVCVLCIIFFICVKQDARDEHHHFSYGDPIFHFSACQKVTIVVLFLFVFPNLRIKSTPFFKLTSFCIVKPIGLYYVDKLFSL